MPISALQANSDKSVFFTDRFKVLVRSEKEILQQRATVIPIVNANDRYAYRYDFYRLLREHNIPTYMWWATAFINDISDPFADHSARTSFLKIDENILMNAYSRSNTRQG